MTWPKTILLAAAMLLSAIILACGFRYATTPAHPSGEESLYGSVYVTDRWTGASKLVFVIPNNDGRGLRLVAITGSGLTGEIPGIGKGIKEQKEVK